MGIDWLKAPANVQASGYETIDWSFDAGYMDIYVVSSKADLADEFNLAQTVAPVKTITMTKVEMGDDSIIVVDADGKYNDMYVYKIRAISPEETAAALAYFNGLVDQGLALVGLDSANAGDTVATAE